jgi:RNA polymerase sigma factor (sigma-70 family)
MDDSELLTAYSEKASQEAFAELVRRHIDLVYSAAVRQTGDRHMADDVTQAVFLVVARKTPTLRSGGMLAGWLVKTTRYAALNAIKYESRRRQHEQQAAAMNLERTSEDVSVNQTDIGALLDGLLCRLSGKDRSALALRYLQGKTIREVGTQMGISEPAAQQRILRALTRLRGMLARHGVHSPSEVVEMSLGQNLCAPNYLLPLISAQALSAAGAASSAGAISAIVKGTIKSVALAHAKVLGTVCAACLVVAGGVSTAVLTAQTESRAGVQSAPSAPPPAAAVAQTPATTPAAAGDDGSALSSLSFLMKDNVNEFVSGIDETVRRGVEPTLTISSATRQWGISERVFRYIDHVPFRGKRMRFSAFVKTQDLANWGSLNLHVFAAGGRLLVSDDMGDRPVTGTTDWKKLEIVSDIPREADSIMVGLHLKGAGQIWMDGAKVEVVGEDIPITDDQTWHAWSFSIPHYKVALDPATLRDGHSTILLSSTAATSGEWATWNKNDRHPEQFLGKRVRMTAWIKSENAASQSSGLYYRLIGPGARDLVPAVKTVIRRGANDWTKYELIADVPLETECICSGVRLYGRGKLWVDDFQYDVIGPAERTK